MKGTKDGKDPVRINKLSYTPCVKTYTPGNKNGEDVEDDAVIAGSFKRLKAKLNTKFEETDDLTKEREITTKVFTLDEDGQPKEEKVTCMKELRDLVTYNSVVRFAIEFNKIWIKNTADAKGFKECSISARVLQIFVVEKGIKGKMQQELSFVFGGPSKTEDTDDEKSEAGSGSDHEEKVPVKSTTKKGSNDSNKKKNKKDSDDEESDKEDSGNDSENGSGNESASPKPKKNTTKPVKTTGKKPTKPARDDEKSESEESEEEVSTPPAKGKGKDKGGKPVKKK